VLALQSEVGNSRLLVCTDWLQQIRLLEVIRPFVLLLRHGYFLVKSIKSIRELEMLENKKRKTVSFI
jgi:hypothetical protein